MPKRDAARRVKRRIKFRRRPAGIAAAILATCLAASALSLGRLETVRRNLGLAPPRVATQGPPPAPGLSKEYIYAGGRLVATEEPGAARSPFPHNAPHAVPGTIQAEDFDEGVEGVAYHDTDPTVNFMGAYRPSPSGVDIEACGAAGCGFNVGYTWAGEWTEYTVSVTSSGAYDVEIPVASGNGGGGSFRLTLDGVDVTGPLQVPNTGGWQAYQLVRKAGVQLSAGTHVLRLSLDSEGPSGGVGNFDFIRFSHAAAGSPPANLLATFQAAATAGQITLTWQPPAGSVDHYEVERAQSPAGPYQTLSANQQTAGFADAVESGVVRAYFYRVRAAFAGGGLSPYSNVDMATTIAFTDDPLVAGSTPIRAAHFTQLRDAVNAVRAAAALQPFNWTGDAPAAGGPPRASHLNDLRASLREAFAALALPGPAYDGPDPMGAGQSVKATNVQQLRDLVK